ncbi:MAG: hypothetical protein KDA05_06790 [Phycisphaerales bacterium]|nr:hypothetical protein [Phycisphaerales bacterium]MCB9840813.1 hypothetical protein [Phycisphaeraceae bacterium]
MAKTRILGATTAIKSVAILALLGGAPGVAIAQIAPPPSTPRTPQATPEAQNPVLPPAMRRPGATADTGPESAADQARRLFNTPARSGELPELPYEPIGKRDDAGNLIMIQDDPHYVALTVNPLLDDDAIERFRGTVAARRNRLEQGVIEHTSLMRQVLDGAINRVDVARPDTLQSAIAVVRPFQEMGSLTEDLRAEGYLTEQQWRFNWKIVGEYEQAVRAEVMRLANENDDPNGPAPMTKVTRAVLGEYLRLPLDVYNDLLGEGAGRLGDVIAAAAITDDDRAIAQDHAGAVGTASTAEARVQAMQALTGAMSPEGHKALLEAIVATR